MVCCCDECGMKKLKFCKTPFHFSSFIKLQLMIVISVIAHISLKIYLSKRIKSQLIESPHDEQNEFYRWPKKLFTFEFFYLSLSLLFSNSFHTKIAHRVIPILQQHISCDLQHGSDHWHPHFEQMILMYTN